MRSPQVRVALLHCTTAGYTPPCLDHESFLVSCPVALLGSASYPILVHRLTVYVPRFLPTLGHPHAVALHFARRDQLATGLAPVGVRPCWAHTKKSHPKVALKNPPRRTRWSFLLNHCDSSCANFSQHQATALSPIWGIWRQFTRIYVPFENNSLAPAAPSGNETTKQAPPSGRFSHWTVPPWRMAIDLTRAKPKPTPPSRSVAPGRR